MSSDKQEQSNDEDQGENNIELKENGECKPEGSDKKIKRKRRCTKEDQSPKTYKCGCNRAYYSYPALYTHLKLKHDGQPPSGTTMPYDKHYGSRGRPKQKQSEKVIEDILINLKDDEQKAFHSDDKEDSYGKPNLRENGVNSLDQ